MTDSVSAFQIAVACRVGRVERLEAAMPSAVIYESRLAEQKLQLEQLAARVDRLEAGRAHNSEYEVIGGPLQSVVGCGRIHNKSEKRCHKTLHYDLYNACSHGCAKCVEALLAKIEDVNLGSNTHNWTPLDFATWGETQLSQATPGHDFPAVRRLLLARGAIRSGGSQS